MKMTPLCLLLLFSAAQTSAVSIASDPGVDGEGVVQVQLDTIVSLECRDGGADEELVWLRNGAAVSLKEGNINGRSSLCISPVVHDDNDATFTCHLRSNASETASVTLNVTYGPQLSGSEEVSVEKEGQLLLQCHMRANPPISSMSWTLNDSMVDLSAGGFTVTNDGFTSRLQASKVDQSLHEGKYQCTADSPIYGQSSKIFYVTVTEKTIKFPMMPMIAGVVVVCLTALLAVVSRWNKITKCCRK